MQTKYIALAVGVVVVLGAAYYFMSGNGSLGDGSIEEGEPAQGDSMMDEGSFSGSFLDLARRGGTYRCTFENETAAGASSGTVYIEGDRLRGDFMSSAQGVTVESHMIQDAGYVYTWSPALPQGFKFKTAVSEGSGDAAMSGQYADLDQSYSYDCDLWSADSSTFELPAGVTFMMAGQ